MVKNIQYDCSQMHLPPEVLPYPLKPLLALASFVEGRMILSNTHCSGASEGEVKRGEGSEGVVRARKGL